ncbi:THAP domain-containing protein 5 isoform X3 [Globicephala melas]|uniref:THAP domain-containing protein 5 isoform X3 n=1 Tax=Globicephala melas TaxID=9731 RepID=UPI00293D8E77|nr:THAP domain-containing protein 5 isoform X3 [Globicephala melas]
MPRYCAAICCKNRRGRNGKDRKLSFYPFPLHDKERLEKWLKNMKRDSWVPSKYQFLCSDHFTPDSLDIRWGIRYLKQTAIPTIFSLPEENQIEEAHVKSLLCTSTVVNRNSKNGHPCLVPDLRGKDFSISPLILMLTMDFSHMTFIVLRYISSGKENKSKNKQMGLHQTEKLLHSKG